MNNNEKRIIIFCSESEGSLVKSGTAEQLISCYFGKISFVYWVNGKRGTKKAKEKLDEFIKINKDIDSLAFLENPDPAKNFPITAIIDSSDKVIKNENGHIALWMGHAVYLDDIIKWL